MPVFYDKEKSKLGSLTGSIITWSRELISNEPTDIDNKDLLPSGYLRCDGSVYSANIYPKLAEVLGTGINCRFKKESQTLRNDQFQVPDLGSKCIRASTSANTGDFNDLYVEDSEGNQILKSGIALDVITNIGTRYQVEYRGAFYLPSQTLRLRGQPSFVRSTGRYTEQSEILHTSVQPHFHFSNTNRCRIANANGDQLGNSQRNRYTVRSTLDACTWFKNTRQELCRLAATRQGLSSSTPTFSNGYCERISGGGCFTGCTFNLSGSATCLIPNNCVTATYPVQGPAGSCPGVPGSASTTTVGNISYTGTLTSNCNSVQFPGCAIGGLLGLNISNQTLSANYEFANMPFDAQIDATGGPYYSSVSNIHTETTSRGNDAIHSHELPLVQQPHTFDVVTTPQNITPESLVSTIDIRLNSSKKADNYIQPYIITEYLIKV